MVTKKEQVFDGPTPSVTVQLTGFAPGGKALPEGGLHETIMFVGGQQEFPGKTV